MTVTTNLQKHDLILFNLLMTPRLRSTYVAIGLIAIAVAAYFVWTDGVPGSGGSWVRITLVSVFGGICGILGGLVFSMLSIVFIHRKDDGVLGEHNFEIREDGLYEETTSNRTVSNWAGMQDVGIVGPFLYFRTSSYLFHIVPMRAFENLNQFRDFAEVSQKTWRGSA